MSLPIDLFVDDQNLKNVADLNLEIVYGQYGDETVSFDLCNWKNILPRWDRPLLLRDPTYGYFWNGYVAPVAPPLLGAAKIGGRGYRYTIPNVPYFYTQIYRKNTFASEMVKNAISKCQYVFDADMIADLSQTLPEDSPDFANQTAEDVFKYAQQLTAYLGTPVIYQVRQNPLNPWYPEAILETKATDFAPRYRVKLNPNTDTFTPTYDPDVVWNIGQVRWGNNQYQLASNFGYSTPMLPQNPNIAPVPPAPDYSVIPFIRYKRIDATQSVVDLQSVQQLAGYLVTRNNVLRPINTTIEIDCTTPIEGIFPAIISTDVPHWLVRNHFTIQIMNDLSGYGMYNVREFYINEARYNFTTGKLTLQVGDPVILDTFNMIVSDIGQFFNTVKSGIVNQARRDADILVQYGPEFPGTSLVPNADDATINNAPAVGLPEYISSTTIQGGTVDTGVPKFDDPAAQYEQPFGKSIDPRLVSDYGTQANFGREADSIGIKGFVRLIPQKVIDWEIGFLPPPNSDTIPSDSITVEFYTTYPFTPGSPFATKSVTASQSASGIFSSLEQRVFAQGAKIGIRVSAPASTAGAGFMVAVGGKKLHPDLGLNT